MEIYVDGILCAIVLKKDKEFCKTQFLTPVDAEFQMGVVVRNRNEIINPHRHIKQQRLLKSTSEALFVRRGDVIVEFYDEKDKVVSSCSLEKGDAILLFGGAHGFKTNDGFELLEIKQGPYQAGADKEALV